MPNHKLWCFSLTNFGDALTPFIFERAGIAFEVVEDAGDANLFGIGSILRRVSPRTHRTLVWTSGMISPTAGSDLRFNQHVEIIALRGLLTKGRVKTPDVGNTPCGDGALLLRKYYDWQAVEKKYDVGIVAHMKDRRNSVVRKIGAEKGNLYIDVLSPVDKVLTAIASCRRIVSSSLHGIIVSDAFSIPNVAVRLQDTTKGIDDSGKFLDYGTALGRTVDPVELSADTQDLSALFDKAPQIPSEGHLDDVVENLEQTLNALR